MGRHRLTESGRSTDLPLRQTEGLLRLIADVLEIDIAIRDHTTLSRRGGGLTILPKQIHRTEPLHLAGR
jgi:Transposase DDE domain